MVRQSIGLAQLTIARVAKPVQRAAWHRYCTAASSLDMTSSAADSASTTVTCEGNDGGRLWAPSAQAGVAGENALARAVWGRLKTHGAVDVDARGAKGVAGVLRSLAYASRDSSRVAEFRVGWASDEEVKYLRFHVRAGERWDAFAKSLGRIIPLTSGPRADFKQLAKAIKVSQKHDGTVAVESSPPEDAAAAYVLAKALAELPRICGRNRSIRCVGVLPEERNAIRVYMFIDGNVIKKA